MNKNRFGNRKQRIKELEGAVMYYRDLAMAYGGAVRAERDWSQGVHDRILARLTAGETDAARIVEDEFSVKCPGRVYDDGEVDADDADVE